MTFCEKFHQVDTNNYINYCKTTKTTYCYRIAVGPKYKHL